MQIFEGGGLWREHLPSQNVKGTNRKISVCSSEESYPKDLVEDGTHGIRCSQAWLANINLLKQLIHFLQQMMRLKMRLGNAINIHVWFDFSSQESLANP